MSVTSPTTVDEILIDSVTPKIIIRYEARSFPVVSRRVVLPLLAVLAFVAGVTGAIMYRHPIRYPTINAEGIEELGLTLEIPRGGENPGDFVIRNSGEHTVIGYRVVYEGHAKSGEVHEWSTMTIQPLAFPSNKERKPEYLSPRFGCIPPGAAIFDGLLRDSQEQDGTTMPEREFGRVWVPGPGFEYYDHIDARLDSVMLEDGQIYGLNRGALIGRTRQTFEEQMNEFLGLPAGDAELNDGDGNE